MGLADNAQLIAARKYYEQSLAEQRALRATLEQTNQLLTAVLQALAPQQQNMPAHQFQAQRRW